MQPQRTALGGTWDRRLDAPEAAGAIERGMSSARNEILLSSAA
jgi:hypothetical protein